MSKVNNYFRIDRRNRAVGRTELVDVLGFNDQHMQSAVEASARADQYRIEGCRAVLFRDPGTFAILRQYPTCNPCPNGRHKAFEPSSPPNPKLKQPQAPHCVRCRTTLDMDGELA